MSRSGDATLHWSEQGQARCALWRSEGGQPLPRRVVCADDTMPADTAYRLACEGTALLWRGDFQNARQLLQAFPPQAADLPDAATPTHKLQCASYTPFDKDQSPFQQPFVLRKERVDADLALLAQRFTCIRTYSQIGLEALPELARKHGLKMLAGAWVSANPADTELEIKALISAANTYPDVIDAVIVGNEVLLRKEATESQLVALIARVKVAVKQPVTYADVWEFWIKHPQMAPAVDFLTIHLLPYWEDDPTGIDAALNQVANVRRAFGSAYAPKDILIGETGWPSEGRQRETALPSRVNEALFIRGFVKLAEDNGWRYNLIEAFDQPWKRQSEGAVGGYWGLFDADRRGLSHSCWHRFCRGRWGNRLLHGGLHGGL